MADLTETTVSVRPRCDVHSMQFNETVPAMYDGKTAHGPWAYMCEECFDALGIGLGLGKGQRLIVEDENDGPTCPECDAPLAHEGATCPNQRLSAHP